MPGQTAAGVTGWEGERGANSARLKESAWVYVRLKEVGVRFKERDCLEASIQQVQCSEHPADPPTHNGNCKRSERSIDQPQELSS